MKIKNRWLGIFIFIALISNFAHSSTDCDPINTMCNSITNRVCETTEAVTKIIPNSICVWVPAPKWYNPHRMKKKCHNVNITKIIPAASTCSNVTGLSCPSITGPANCNVAIEEASNCLKDPSTCKTAIDKLAFGPLCSVAAIHMGQIMELGYETRLYDVIDASVDVKINEIFGTLLGDPSFANYVRGTVETYLTSSDALKATGVSGAEQMGKTIPGKIFFNVQDPDIDLVLHELTHIWQFRKKGVSGLTAQGCSEIYDNIVNGGDKDTPYQFTLVKGKKFADYGLEQQAEIVQTYVQFGNGLSSCPAHFLNCASYPDNASRKAALRSAISGITPLLAYTGYCSSCSSERLSCENKGGQFILMGGGPGGSPFLCTNK